MRSNHCFSCDACVAKQDHHSIWTNSCIGKTNCSMEQARKYMWSCQTYHVSFYFESRDFHWGLTIILIICEFSQFVLLCGLHVIFSWFQRRSFKTVLAFLIFDPLCLYPYYCCLFIKNLILLVHCKSTTSHQYNIVTVLKSVGPIVIFDVVHIAQTRALIYLYFNIHLKMIHACLDVMGCDTWSSFSLNTSVVLQVRGTITTSSSFCSRSCWWEPGCSTAASCVSDMTYGVMTFWCSFTFTQGTHSCALCLFSDWSTHCVLHYEAWGLWDVVSALVSCSPWVLSIFLLAFYHTCWSGLVLLLQLHQVTGCVESVRHFTVFSLFTFIDEFSSACISIIYIVITSTWNTHI